MGLEGRSLTDAGQRVRTAVRRGGVPFPPGSRLSLSIGLTEARNGDSAASLIARADALRAEARLRGPDQVVGDVLARD